MEIGKVEHDDDVNGYISVSSNKYNPDSAMLRIRFESRSNTWKLSDGSLTASISFTPKQSASVVLGPYEQIESRTPLLKESKFPYAQRMKSYRDDRKRWLHHMELLRKEPYDI